jgi:hypothetical protein
MAESTASARLSVVIVRVSVVLISIWNVSDLLGGLGKSAGEQEHAKSVATLFDQAMSDCELKFDVDARFRLRSPAL